jgi:KRAB domain-containing zinc finger protein
MKLMISFQSTICDICEKPLSSIRNMLRHRKTHRSVEERSFKCTVCYKIMVNEFSLKNHMRTHDSSKSHVCDVCGMAFVTNSGLNVSPFNLEIVFQSLTIFFVGTQANP